MKPFCMQAIVSFVIVYVGVRGDLSLKSVCEALSYTFIWWCLLCV